MSVGEESSNYGQALMEAENNVDSLQDRAKSGDSAAVAQLFDEYRSRLRRMVEIRLHPRLSGRGRSVRCASRGLCRRSRPNSRIPKLRHSIFCLVKIESRTSTGRFASFSSPSARKREAPWTRSFARSRADADGLFGVSCRPIDGPDDFGK